MFPRRHMTGQKDYIKKCLTLIIREMKMKTTVRYHLIPINSNKKKPKKKSKTIQNKHTRNNKYWQVFGKKENSCAVLVGM